MTHATLRCFAIFGTVLLLGAGCSTTTSQDTSASKVLPNAALRPSVVYVTDFYLDPAELAQAQSANRAGIIGSRLRAIRGEDPAQQAQALIQALSKSIVTTLNQGGQKAEYLPNPDGLRSHFLSPEARLPKTGWIVGGWFTKVDQGNRAAQATLGFGAGAEDIQTEVVVSDLASAVNEPFLRIGTASAPNRMPGGLVAGKNPYVMAAKFVLSRGANERDVQQQGREIARELMGYINTGGRTPSAER